MSLESYGPWDKFKKYADNPSPVDPPTPAYLEWARNNFSSRVEPPKEIPTV